MGKRKRIVPYSDSESDDKSPKKKYLKKEESGSEDDFFSPKKKPLRMIEDNDEKNKNRRNLYDFNDVISKKSRKFRTESHVVTTSFKRFADLPPRQLGGLFDDVSQQIKQKVNAEPYMIRLSINHTSLDMGIHIPFMYAEQLEGTVLLDQMQKVLQ